MNQVRQRGIKEPPVALHRCLAFEADLNPNLPVFSGAFLHELVDDDLQIQGLDPEVCPGFQPGVHERLIDQFDQALEASLKVLKRPDLL